MPEDNLILTSGQFSLLGISGVWFILFIVITEGIVDFFGGIYEESYF